MNECHHLVMAIAGRIPVAGRVWFSDPRTPLRRMSVATHPAEGIAVVSLWQGQTCTSTFRLPLTEAARMITALAYGMSAGLVEPATNAETPRPPWNAFLNWVRRWLPRSSSIPHTDLRILK
jgi:hypothetical protein